MHSSGVCHTGLLTACEQDQDGMQFHPDPVRKLSANPYDIHHCCVYSEILLDVQRNCPKHVEIHSKNKFEKLVHLVSFIMRNFREACCFHPQATRSRQQACPRHQ